MSTALAVGAGERGADVAKASRFAGRPGWLPLHAWSGGQRRAVALAIALIAGVATSAACIVWDPLDVHAARAAQANAQKRRDEAQRALARLPALRAGAAASVSRVPYAGNSADDIRRVSQLAAQSGLVLHALEPGAAGGAKAEAFRSIKLVAQGSFAQLRALLEGFSREPALTAPSELTIRRTATGLSITATVHVYDALPALPLTESSHEGTAADPFSRAASAGTGSEGWRLAGILEDGQHIVALVETPEGVMTAQAGQRFGDGRVIQIAPARVVVFSGGETRTLNWAERAK
jgi:hypothetical protein